MRLGLGLGLRGVLSSFNFPPIGPLAGVFPLARATLDDQSHYLPGSSTQPVTPIAGALTMGNSGIAVFSLPSALTGNYWIMTRTTDGVIISFRPGFLSPAYTPEALRSRGGVQVWQFPAVAGSTQMRFIAGSTYGGDLTDLQAVDMAATLPMPADVYVCRCAQSNTIGVPTDEGYDWTRDGWADKRLMYAAGSSNSGHGTTVAGVTALRAPIQQQANSADALTPGFITQAVSPLINFARYILPYANPARRIVICATSVSGTGGDDASGAGGAWNPLSSNPFAYNHMMTTVAALMPTLPAGSVIKAGIGAFGETDTKADMSGHYAAVARTLNTSGDAWVSAGYCASRPPQLFFGPPIDATRSNQAVLIDTYRRMDQNSGQPQAIAGVHVSESRAYGMAVDGGIPDGTHCSAAANRQRGIDLGLLAVSRGLV